MRFEAKVSISMSDIWKTGEMLDRYQILDNCHHRRKNIVLSPPPIYLVCLLLLVLFPSRSLVNAFTTTPFRSIHHQFGRGNLHSHSPASPPLHSVSKRQVAIIDGAELNSIDSFLRIDSDKQLSPRNTSPVVPKRVGYVTVSAGTEDEKGRRVVGIEVASDGDGTDDVSSLSLGNGVRLYLESIASIPSGVSDDDAISTLIASLAGVHCALPRAENVGGDGGEGGTFAGGKVVVLGGGDYAVFAADALALLGAEVFLVSNGNPRPKNRAVKVMKPEVGNEEIAFSEWLGEFDALVDTLADEVPSIISELRRRNKCDRYVSTFSQSQKIIREKGLLFGRGDAKEYVMSTMTRSITSGADNNLLPPKGFGKQTVQRLLDGKVLYKAAGKDKGKDVVVREWSLQDFWEYTSWPRDVAGNGDTRFGLPIPPGFEEEDDLMFSTLQYDDDEPDGVEGFRDGAKPMSDESKEELSPFVVSIKGVEGLNQRLLSNKKQVVLFMSASWCRKCRALKPRYNKIARESPLPDDELTYAQADTTGVAGKMLSRYLDVDAIPAFVLFKDGKQYGEKILVSRLPSKKLSAAVDMMVSGRDYDPTVIANADTEVN